MSDAADRATAEAEFLRAVPIAAEPVLTSGEVDSIIDNNQRAQRWAASVVLTRGTRVMPNTRIGRVYEVTTGGTTGATEPTWTDEDGAEVTSGTVTFTEVGRDFVNVYDVRAAIQEGWLLKASKAAEALSKDGENVIFEHCQQMAERYAVPLVA